nr:substrate-binding domain-containing protein [Spirochaetaceae bacterium]
QGDNIDFLIGVSNSSMLEQWRLKLNAELQEAADLYPNLSTVFTDAASSPDKQIKDIETLMGFGIDLLIISPCDVEALTPVISRIYEIIPVIILDRVIDGYDYTLFIGPDNDNIGRLGARALNNILGPQGGFILEISGPGDQLYSKVRSRGLNREIEEKYHNITIADQLFVFPQTRDNAEDLLLSYSSKLDGIDAIYTHSDGLALGVSRALMKLGREDIPIVGTDGLTGENGGFELVQKGLIHSSIESSTGGKEAIQYALDILKKRNGVPKQIILKSQIVNRSNLSDVYDLKENEIKRSDKPITLGYAQVGTESSWRVSNTKSIVQAAKEFDIELIYRDADQNQETQIKHLREFIKVGVDVILLSPIIEEGYNDILKEAKNAGIPVLLSDRKINNDDEDLYSTFIGGDFKEEGRRAARWIQKNFSRRETRILELQGTPGATPTEERRDGFSEIIDEEDNLQIVYSRSGYFTEEQGYQIIIKYITDHYPLDIDVIYAHNDDMILGAIKALKEKGIVPGKDVKLISVDGTLPAMNALKKGEMNFLVECTPLLGNQVMTAVVDVMDGKDLPMRIVTDERTFTTDQVDDNLIRGRSY